MSFKTFVQIGRVAFVAYGADEGKLVAIVDIIDVNKVLVDGPGFMRKALNLKSLYLTKFLVRIPHSARSSTLMKQWVKCEIDKKWAESNWAKKLAAAKIRANLTDFQRYKLMRAKQARNRMITLETGKLRLKTKKANAELRKSGKKVKKVKKPAAPAAKPAAAAAAKPAAKPAAKK